MCGDEWVWGDAKVKETSHLDCPLYLKNAIVETSLISVFFCLLRNDLNTLFFFNYYKLAQNLKRTLENTSNKIKFRFLMSNKRDKPKNGCCVVDVKVAKAYPYLCKQIAKRGKNWWDVEGRTRLRCRLVEPESYIKSWMDGMLEQLPLYNRGRRNKMKTACLLLFVGAVVVSCIGALGTRKLDTSISFNLHCNPHCENFYSVKSYLLLMA